MYVEQAEDNAEFTRDWFCYGYAAATALRIKRWYGYDVQRVKTEHGFLCVIEK